MGPKKKKKTNEPEVNEVEETERKQKAAKALAYFKETQKEERDFNEFQQQREKLNYFWIVEKKKLEDCKAELRNKEREAQDLEEKHKVEITVFKQKVKHLLYENQNELTQRKTEDETALKSKQDDHRLAELDLKDDRRSLRLQLKEMELSQDDFLKSLKEGHDKNITELRHDFERMGSEVQRNYEKKTKVVRERLEEIRKRETAAIEQAKNAHIEQLMASHTKAFAEIKNYYNDITHNNLDLIKSLKEEVGEMRRKEQQDEKQMEHIASENRRMSEPFKKAKKDVDELRNELVRYGKEKSELRAVKAKLLVVESQLQSLKWDNEVLSQRYNAVTSQRDTLKAKFTSVAADVKQKAQFKTLLLEKKLSAITETLEARDAQLDDALARANVDVSALGVQAKHGKSKNIVEKKKNELADLRNELARVANAHAALVQAVASKMTELGVPVQELGFTPLDASAQLRKKLGRPSPRPKSPTSRFPSPHKSSPFVSGSHLQSPSPPKDAHDDLQSQPPVVLPKTAPGSA